MCFPDNKFDLHNILTKLLQTAAPIMPLTNQFTNLTSQPTNQPTNQLTDKQLMNERIPWSRAIPEKLTGPQVVKIFPAYYGT